MNGEDMIFTLVACLVLVIAVNIIFAIAGVMFQGVFYLLGLALSYVLNGVIYIVISPYFLTRFCLKKIVSMYHAKKMRDVELTSC